MYKHILVALDGKPESEQALKQAVAIARLAGAELTGLSVIEHLPAYAASMGEVEDSVQEAERFFNRIQENAQRAATIAGVVLHSVIRKGSAAQAIVRFAIENRVDLIVVGAESYRNLGSTADRVTETAPCSVLIARIDLSSLRVKDVMTREVFAIAPNTPLSEVVKLMVETGLKAMPVLENERIVGIITGGDLLSRADMEWRLSIQRILPEHLFMKQIQHLTDEGKTARDIMSSPIITIQEGDSVTHAIEMMTKNSIKRLPVLNEDGFMVGIISRMDILAVAASWGLSNGIFPAMSVTQPRTAEDIMFKEIPTAPPDAPLGEVINSIVATPLRRVVVVDERQHVLGIIVDANLIKAVRPEKTGAVQNLLSLFSAEKEQLVRSNGQASDVMDRNVYTVQLDASLKEVIQMMIDRRVKRVVVTDQENRLMGMISRESLLNMLIS